MIYRSGERIRPHQIRAVTFGSQRRGLDPEEVYAYLSRVADELDHLLRAETTARTEVERIRQGLRQWQSRHANCRYAPDPDRRLPNRGRW